MSDYTLLEIVGKTTDFATDFFGGKKKINLRPILRPIRREQDQFMERKNGRKIGRKFIFCDRFYDRYVKAKNQF